MQTNLKTVSKRQARKLQGGTSDKAEAFRKATGLTFAPFLPTYSTPHPSGMNRHARRRYLSTARGKGVASERGKTRLRGEAYGRQLEHLIRSGATFQVVQDFKLGIVRSMKKRVVTKLRARTKASQGEAVASLSKTTRVLSKKATSPAFSESSKRSVPDRISGMFKRKSLAK
jgi:hypothetical protein